MKYEKKIKKNFSPAMSSQTKQMVGANEM